MDKADRVDKINVNEIDLNLQTIEFYNNTIIVGWISNDIGYGEWTLSMNENEELEVSTSYMDSGENKEFSKRIFELLLEKIKIID